MFKEIAEKFVENLFCFHTLANSSILGLSIIEREENKKFNEYNQTHNIALKKEGDREVFSVPVDLTSTFEKLYNRRNRVRRGVHLIPKSILISMVGEMDNLINNLLYNYFELHPGKLDESDRKLSYSELKDFSNIEEAKKYIVEIEIESVLRKSHSDHFKYFENILKIPLTKDLPSYSIYIEITERRNLLVHTEGKVSSQYLKVCNVFCPELVKDIKVGDKLVVSYEYFNKSFEVLFEIGFKLCLVFWNKLTTKEIESIDSTIIDVTFQLINEKNYTLAINILEFCTSNVFKHFDKDTELIMIINKAQAYKWNGQTDKMNQIISQIDWSAFGYKYQLCKNVLIDDIDEAIKYMDLLKHDKSFSSQFYFQWPIFKEMRKKEKFISAFKEFYGSEPTVSFE